MSESISYPDDHIFYDWAYLQYLLRQERDAELLTYVEQHFNDESLGYEVSLMFKYPFFAVKILDDYEMTNDEKQEKLFNKLVYDDQGGGRICLIDGAKGGGKTGVLCWILDEYHKRRPDLKYYFVTKATIRPPLPSWINVVDSIDQVPNNCIAGIDEGGIQLSSRGAMTRENKDASTQLIVLRHKGISMIILVQNVLMVDINVRRLADIRLLKYGIPFGTERKRPGEQTNKDLELIRQRLKPRNNKEAYVEIMSDKIFVNFSHPLPKWWNDDEISKSYKYTELKSQEKIPDATDVLK